MLSSILAAQIDEPTMRDALACMGSDEIEIARSVTADAEARSVVRRADLRDRRTAVFRAQDQLVQVRLDRVLRR